MHLVNLLPFVLAAVAAARAPVPCNSHSTCEFEAACRWDIDEFRKDVHGKFAYNAGYCDPNLGCFKDSLQQGTLPNGQHKVACDFNPRFPSPSIPRDS